MIKRFASFALHQPLFLFMLLALFVAGGIVAFKSLPIEAFPDVSDVQVTVITLFPGHAPEEVEKQVTIPLEIELSGLPHSVRMFSHTQFGLSFIMLTFDDQVDDYFARQQVLEHLQNVSLPPNVQPNLAPLSSPVGEIYRYRVKGNETYNPMELRSIQDWEITRYLKMTPGVADIVSLGGYIKQYQVNVDLAKMKFYRIPLQQVLTALNRGNANAGGSFLEQGEQQYIIRGIGLLTSPEDINNIVVAAQKGSPIRIRDIAVVSMSHVPRQGVVGQDKEGEIVSGIVLLRKGENPSEVLTALKERIETLNKNVLPKGVEIVPYYDRAVLIHTTLKTVFENLLEGALLVTIVLFIFLGVFRPAAIVAIIIPLSLLATFIGLRLRGIPANLLSLGAMDFGIIVDGAVIIVENIFRKLVEQKHHHEEHASIRSTILEATAEVGRPTLFSMFIIICANIPIFALQRQEGRIFAPMAYTMTSALIGSLLFSITLVPLLCFYFLKKGVPEQENRAIKFCKRHYHRLLVAAIRMRKRVLIVAIGALIASLLVVSHLGTEFLPELNEGSLWVSTDLPPGIALSEVKRICDKARSIIGAFPEVKTVVSKAGRPEDGTDPKTVNMIEFFVDLKPVSEWKRFHDKQKLIDEMNKALQAIPGFDPGFSQPIRDNVLESISQIKGQIVIKVFGDDDAVLKMKANEILNEVSPVKGVARAFVDRAGEMPQLRIEIDRKEAARYGLNVSDIEDVIETALGGKSATDLWEGEKHFSVVVRLPERERQNVEAIKNVLVDTPEGFRVPLEAVAKIIVRNGSLNISREGGRRVAAVGIFIEGRDMGGIVSEMKKIVHQKIALPSGYYVTWSGEFENQERAMNRLLLIVPISVFLIFILLFDAFQSAKYAFLILMNVPFALIGGIFALFVTGIHLSVSAAIGFIALFGQAVLNGVVMISYFNQLREQGLGPYKSVLEGCLVRLRTILMTALLAMFGLLPMALSHGIGSEVQKPLAVVIIGGLISATPLTLIVLPILYLMLVERNAREI